MQIAVLPMPRGSGRLARLARQRGFVAGRCVPAAELERGLVPRRPAGCERARQISHLRSRSSSPSGEGGRAIHSPGPYFAIRNHAGYARALGDLLSALTHGLLLPS